MDLCAHAFPTLTRGSEKSRETCWARGTFKLGLDATAAAFTAQSLLLDTGVRRGLVPTVVEWKDLLFAQF